jgi:hypothetical protein
MENERIPPSCVRTVFPSPTGDAWASTVIDLYVPDSDGLGIVV